MNDLSTRILDCFPTGNYALVGLLRLLDIVESDAVPTAAVECSAQPRLLVNPHFLAQYAATPERLLMLVMHELHHVLLGHTRLFPCLTPTDNFIFDAIINAAISRLLPGEEHVGLLTDYYSAERFPECLLRPPPAWDGRFVRAFPIGLGTVPARLRPRVRDLYAALYSEAGASYEEVAAVLPKALADEGGGVPLLGGHEKSDGTSDLSEASAALFDAVCSIVGEWPDPPDPLRGRSLESLAREERVAIRRTPSRRAVLRGLLRRIADRNGHGRIQDRRETSVPVLGAIPGHDRRTLVQTALGARPLLHPARVPLRALVRSGERVHVYLDVSGSMNSVLPVLYGALSDCRELLHPQVHLFSTEVADIGIRDLLSGVRLTTGGTSISCVAAHIAAKGIRRACIVTDGYVGTPDAAERRILSEVRLGVALAGSCRTAADLASCADHLVTLPEGD